MTAIFKTWFHRWGSPKWFYDRGRRWQQIFTFVALVMVPLGVLWGLAFAPVDYQQGHSYRIIYLHVPAAFVAQSCYIMMAVAGVVSLVWKMKVADVVLISAAPIGLSFCFIALFTGAVWGKPTWGTWWIWDARLTSMLILLFLYIGILALYSAIEDLAAAGRACALLAIVGVVNIPIIKYSVDWWNTLHQPASLKLTERPSMPAEMWVPLLVCIIGFYALFLALVFLRTRNEIIRRERRTLWVRSLVSGTVVPDSAIPGSGAQP
ncbi:heme ABC transporter permease [Allohahella sp. A8]|uniref:heme ABC transporter permease n=1 Tax=Allohahella sp. A8 TaxID=3141461 RepID=UPI000C091FD0|nr:heme ABC transporter permease [Hahellaceae bacterium]|tara:strand:- start:17763 stop:18554 length:792 start_codon:yes stop_codon:yes gene_type:complete